ncbi:GNAT superfamily N-acetyltransferase [Kitasatospora sp. MAP12-15]|uniref:GNAT family N-acetyltransferase n=1 Tax=unclassified Kitasatospora TaxID=2633591 RepID=UPI00247388B6|nr:GNAT family N-acetyltransferase [Kitasatospora sp. MAP12-44]MDH6108814.1 GNAT superfamily N-acetyltransferase [Kitasatospora sp. MAP12-44]
MVAELARAWVAGWSVSRGTPAPVEEPWGLRIEVGLPNHVTRHVLPTADESTVRALAGSVSTPGTWIKAFVPPETLGGWLSPDWTPSEPVFLMSTDLRPGATRAPVGYTLTADTSRGVTRVRVTAADGSAAARGQVATVGAAAVIDQIVTEPDHQRRGLGTVVMRSLANTALAQGATLGVLGASIEGRALYESLGWAVRAPLAGFVYRSTEPR